MNSARWKAEEYCALLATGEEVKKKENDDKSRGCGLIAGSDRPNKRPNSGSTKKRRRKQEPGAPFLRKHKVENKKREEKKKKKEKERKKRKGG